MGKFEIGDGINKVTIPNHFKAEEEVRRFLLAELEKLHQEKKANGGDVSKISVRYNPTGVIE